jgi:outer membrane protein assembly factor BamB
MFTAAYPNNYFVAALDAQTGVERWRYAYPVQSDNNQFAPAYDPQHQLVYVFIDVGIVSALDAHTGSVVWSLQLSYFTAAQPLLAGGMIYVPGTSNPNSNQTVYLTAIDAADAARRAAAGGPPVTAWTTPMSPQGTTPTPTAPVYAAGYVYCAAWSADTQATYFLSVFKLDAATGRVVWANGQAFYMPDTWTPASVAPILSTFNTLQALLVNVAQGVAAFELESGQQV